MIANAEKNIFIPQYYTSAQIASLILTTDLAVILLSLLISI
jgi:hypothetical protein